MSAASGVTIEKFGESGITLIELMTVVAVLAIGAAIAVPNYITWNARHQLKQAITELHSNLNLARMTARNRNTTVTVQVATGVVDPADGRSKITVTFTDANGGTVLQPQRIRIDILTYTGPATIRFSSLGLLVGVGTTTQTLRLTHVNGLAYEIQITPGGKARWCPGACA